MIDWQEGWLEAGVLQAVLFVLLNVVALSAVSVLSFLLASFRSEGANPSFL